MSDTKRVIAFGEILWDLLPSGAVLGGAPFNFIYRINCLGDDGIIISAVGKDDLGRKALEIVSNLGIDKNFIQIVDGYPTGTVNVIFEGNDIDYEINPDVAYDHIRLTELYCDSLKQTDCIYFGTVAQRSKESRKTLYDLLSEANNKLKILDLNLRKDSYTKQIITDSLTFADILKLNNDELKELADMLSLQGNDISALSACIVGRYSLKCSVVTLGSNGALAVSADGEQVSVPGYKTKVVDTVGCGDAFTAGFIYKYLRNSSLAECCRFGNIIGAIVASQKGGTMPISVSDIEGFACQKKLDAEKAK